MNKYVVLGIFAVIFFTGVGVIIVSHSVSPSDFFRSLSNLNPRALSILALPIIAVIFALGVYYHRRSQDRMWKKALLQTRARAAEKSKDSNKRKGQK